MAFGSFLQHDNGPSQVLCIDPIRPTLPSPSLPLGYLHLYGLLCHRRSMDDPEWLFLLHSYTRLLESISRDPPDKVSTRRPCLVHQCGTPDIYRSGDIDIAPATIMEVTATKTTKVGDTCGFRSWNPVSQSESCVVDIGN